MFSRNAAAPILVYRDHLLPFSEVWVRSQGEALKRFQPYYVGSKKFGDVPLPEERTFRINRGGISGRIEEALLKTTGWAPALDRFAHQIAPALIHAHFGTDGALLLPLMHRLRVPLVTTFHGFDAMISDSFAARSFFLHRRYIRTRAALAREGSLFIAVSKFIRDLLLQQGFPSDRTVVHYIGVDVEFFTPDPQQPREPFVLFVGRLSPEKGCRYLIQAMAEIQAAHPDVELVVIGDGPERSALETMAMNSLRRYRFLGVQTQQSIRAWLNRARVFCVPSLRIESGRGEAFGLVFAEAQAMGVPVVSFASGGLPEAVAHGQTGFLVQERDARSMARSLAGLLDDDFLWRRMSDVAQARTRRLFNLRHQTKILEDLYSQVLQAPLTQPATERRAVAS